MARELLRQIGSVAADLWEFTALEAAGEVRGVEEQARMRHVLRQQRPEAELLKGDHHNDDCSLAVSVAAGAKRPPGWDR